MIPILEKTNSTGARLELVANSAAGGVAGPCFTGVRCNCDAGAMHRTDIQEQLDLKKREAA